MKKRLMMIFASLFVFSVLTACAQNNNEPPPENNLNQGQTDRNGTTNNDNDLNNAVENGANDLGLDDQNNGMNNNNLNGTNNNRNATNNGPEPAADLINGNDDRNR